VIAKGGHGPFRGLDAPFALKKKILEAEVGRQEGKRSFDACIALTIIVPLKRPDQMHAAAGLRFAITGIIR